MVREPCDRRRMGIYRNTIISLDTGAGMVYDWGSSLKYEGCFAPEARIPRLAGSPDLGIGVNLALSMKAAAVLVLLSARWDSGQAAATRGERRNRA